jgi:hypothetical protein
MEVGAALRSPVFLFRSSELGPRSRFLPLHCVNSLQLGQRGRASYGSVQVLADLSSNLRYFAFGDFVLSCIYMIWNLT